jgi:hypothetical protein
LKLHRIVVYSEIFLTTTMPLHAWRKPIAFIIIGKGLGPSTICAARILLPGSCCVAAQFFLDCHPVSASGLSGQDIGVSTTRWPRRLCSAKPIHGFVQPSTAVVFLKLFFRSMYSLSHVHSASFSGDSVLECAPKLKTPVVFEETKKPGEFSECTFTVLMFFSSAVLMRLEVFWMKGRRASGLLRPHGCLICCGDRRSHLLV